MFDPLRECVCGEFILPLDRHYGYFLFTIAGSFYNVPYKSFYDFSYPKRLLMMVMMISAKVNPIVP